jgi:hypothetical protein
MHVLEKNVAKRNKDFVQVFIRSGDSARSKEEPVNKPILISRKSLKTNLKSNNVLDTWSTVSQRRQRGIGQFGTMSHVENNQLGAAAHYCRDRSIGEPPATV